MPRKLMIDSGAFSVWSLGIEIDLNAYIRFCKKHEKMIEVIVALDVIPGTFGVKKITQQSIDDSCKKGFDNYMKMLEAGLPQEKVLPVFHQFDDFKWLDKYLEVGCPYIGLSPNKKVVTRAQQVLWLDRCMERLTDADGYPIVKFHGFGIHSIPMVVRYPFYSVDSAGSVKIAIRGQSLVPHRKNGVWDFQRVPRLFSFSNKASGEQARAVQFRTISKCHKDTILAFMKEAGVVIGESEFRTEELGYKLKDDERGVKKNGKLEIQKIIKEGLSNCPGERLTMNIHFLQELSKSLQFRRKFKVKRNSLYSVCLPPPPSKISFIGTDIYIAGNSVGTRVDSAFDTLRICDLRLLSYHYILEGGTAEKEWTEILTERKNKR